MLKVSLFKRTCKKISRETRIVLHKMADGNIAMEIRDILTYEILSREFPFVGQQQRSSTCAKGFTQRGKVEDSIGSHFLYFWPHRTIAVGMEVGDLAVFNDAEYGSRYDGIGDSCMNSAIGFVDTIGGLRRKRVAGKKRCEKKKFGFHCFNFISVERRVYGVECMV